MSGLEELLVSPWFWLVGGLVIAGLELLAAGVFLLWIGIGAMIVGLALLLFPGMSTTAQLLVFALAMLGSIGLGFVIQRRSGEPQASEINRELHAFVGRHCEAASDFATGRGRIRVGDTTYGAIGEESIRAGEIVEIVAAEPGEMRVARLAGTAGPDGG